MFNPELYIWTMWSGYSTHMLTDKQYSHIFSEVSNDFDITVHAALIKAVSVFELIPDITR